MPNNIDQRVVQMTFDNKQFEQGVSKSLKTLDDLKKALDLDKMSKSISSLEKTTNAVSDSMSVLQNSVNKIAGVFTPLGNLGVNALNRISQAALDAGEKFLKLATGMDALQAGQAKYETYTKSVQTITNATGKSLEEVEKVLDKLQKYTDETSYDFAEMASSIGKFTSVGLDLKKSEEAMEGIANWAALSGAGKAEANRAMYNISQAMGTGAMKLIDWKSIENANMATKEFKETAIQTAIELGVLQKKGEGVGSIVRQTSKGVLETTVDFKSFNSTLEAGWLNTDVLMATLQKYGDKDNPLNELGQRAFKAAQEALTFTDAIDALKDAVSSGWMESFKYMFGNLNEAKTLWTNVANALIEFSDIFTSTRNELLKGWHELGGYNSAVEAASNIWHTFMNVVLGVKDTLEEVFPPMTAQNLVDVTKKIEEATASLRKSFGIDTEIEVTKTIETIKNEAEELTQNLERGAKGDWVKKLQIQLIKAGYLNDKYGADGIYGPGTEKAVKSLQKALGVDVTGAWDDVTRSAAIAKEVFTSVDKKEIPETLTNMKEVRETVQETVDHIKELNHVNIFRGMKKKDEAMPYIKKLQEELIRTGYLGEKATADGIYGPKTEAAVKKLQEALGVEITGKWDKATYYAAKAAGTFAETIETEKVTYEEIEGITDKMITLQDIMKGIFSTVKFFITLVKTGLKIAGNIAKMFTPLLTPLARVGAMFGKIINYTEQLIEYGGSFEQVIKDVTNFFSPLADAIEVVAGWINDFVDGYERFLDLYFVGKPIYSETGDLILNNLNEYGGSFKHFFEYVVSLMEKSDLGRALIDLYNSFKSIFGSITTFIKNIIDTISGPQLEAKENPIIVFFKTFVKILTVVVQGLAAIMKTVAKIVKVILDNLGKLIGPVIPKVIKFFTNLIDNIKEFVSEYNAFSKKSDKNKGIGGFIDYLVEKFKNNEFVQILSTMWESIKSIGTSIITFVTGIYGSLFKSGDKADKKDKGNNSPIIVFFNTLLKVITVVAKGLAIVVGVIAYLVSLIIDNLGKLLGPILPKIRDFFENLFETFKNADIKNVGDFFKTLGESLKKLTIVQSILKIKDKIVEFFKTIGSSASEFMENNFPGAYEFFKGKWEAFKSLFKWDNEKTIFENLSEWETTAFNKIIEGFNNLKETVVTFVNTHFPNLAKTLSGIWEKIKGVFERNWDPKKSFLQNVLDLAGKVVSKIKGAFEKVKEFIAEIFTPDENGDITIVSVLKNAITKLGELKDKFLKVLGELFDPIKKKTEDFLKDKPFTSVFDKIKEFFGKILSYDWSKLIGPAIGILAGYTIFSSAKALKNLSKSLLGLGDALSGGKLLGKKDPIGDTALKIAGSILMIAAAVGVLSFIKWDDAKDGILAFLAIVGIISVAMIAVDKLGSGATNMGYQILAIAGSLAVLAGGLWLLIQVLKDGWKEENRGYLVAAGGIIIGMTILLGLVEALIARSSKGNAFNISGILQMCIGIGVLVLAFGYLVKTIENYELEDIKWAGIIMAGMIVALGTIEVLVAALGKTSGKKISGALTFCLGIGVLVLAFGHLVSIVEEYELEDIKWAGIIMAGMIVAVGGISIAMAAIGPSIGTGISSLSIFLSFVYSIKLLADVFTENILKAVEDSSLEDVQWAAGIMAGMFVALGGIAIAMAAIGPNIASGLASAGIILSLAYAIKIVADAFAEDILKIQDVDLGIIIAFFGGMETIIVTLGIIAGIMGAIPLPALLQGMIGLTAFIILVGAAVGLVGTIGAQAIDNLGSSLWLVGNKLSEVSKQLEGVNWEVFDTAKAYLTDTIVTMLAAAASLDTKTALDKMNELAEFGGLFANFAGTIGSIGEDTENKIAYATTLAESASGIYEALNDIEPIEGIDETLVSLGAALSLYYDELEGIGTDPETGEISSIPTVDAQMIKDAFEALAEAAPDESIDVIQSFVPEGKRDMASVAIGIKSLGAAIESYGRHVGTLKPKKIESANSILKTFGVLYATIQTNDPVMKVLNYFMGDTFSDLSKFAGNMEQINSALKGYVTVSNGINKEKIELANSTIQFFKDINDTLPKEGGISDWWYGKKNLGSFASNFGSLGTGVKNFCDALVGADFSNVNSGLTAIRQLARTLSILDPTGGLLGWLSGDQSLSVLGKGLPELGQSLRGFETNISGFKYENVKEALNTFKQIVEMASSIYGDTVWIDSKTNIEHNKIADIGQGIRDMFQSLGDILSDKVTLERNVLGSPTKTIGVIDAVIQVGSKLVDGLKNGITGDDNANSTIIANALTSIIIPAAENAKALETNFKSTGSTLLYGLITGVNKVESFKNIIYNLCLNGLNRISELQTNYNHSGSDLLYYLLTGLNKADSVKNTIYNMGSRAASNAKEELYDEYKATGSYLVRGLRNGVTENAYLVVSAVKNMCKTAMTAGRNVTGVASPSKEFEWTAEMWVEGMVNGINKDQDDPAKAMEELCENVMNSANGTFKGMDGITGNISDAISTATSALDNTGDIGQTLNDAMKNTSETFLNTDEIAKTITDTINNTTAAFNGNEDATNLVTNAINSVTDSLGELPNVSELVTSAIGNVTDAFKGTEDGSGIIQNAINTVTETFKGSEDGPNILTDAMNKVTESLSDTSDISSIMSDAMDQVYSSIDDTGSATDYLKDSLDGVSDSFGDISDMTDSFSETMNSATQDYSSAVDSIVSKNSELADSMTETYKTSETAKKSINTNGIGKPIKANPDDIQITDTGNLMSKLFPSLENAYTYVTGFVDNLWTSIHDNIGTAISEKGSPLEMLTGYLEEAFNGLSEGDGPDFMLRPVLSFDNMSIGGTTAGQLASGIQSISSGQAQINAVVSTDQATGLKLEMYETYLDQINGKLNVLIDKYDTQASSLNKLGDDIKNLKIVMNTGTVVGEILPSVNKALGKLGFIDSRSR